MGRRAREARNEAALTAVDPFRITTLADAAPFRARIERWGRDTMGYALVVLRRAG